jgi:hypothetical protein
MKGILKYILLSLSIVLFSTLIHAEETSVEIDVEEAVGVEETVEKNYLYKNEITRLKRFLENEQYSTALFDLEALSKKIRAMQAKHIESFFPKRVSGFESKPWGGPLTDSEFGANDTVICSQSYSNEEGSTIELHVVHSDPSIHEFVNVIKKPRILRSLGNASVVDIKNYKALKKENQTHREYNIVLNEELMVTLIFNGEITDHEVHFFLSQAQLAALESYLKK